MSSRTTDERARSVLSSAGPNERALKFTTKKTFAENDMQVLIRVFDKAAPFACGSLVYPRNGPPGRYLEDFRLAATELDITPNRTMLAQQMAGGAGGDLDAFDASDTILEGGVESDDGPQTTRGILAAWRRGVDMKWTALASPGEKATARGGAKSKIVPREAHDQPETPKVPQRLVE